MFVSTQAAGPSRVPSPLYCNSHGSSDGMRTVMVAGLQGDNLMGVQLIGALNQSMHTLALSGSLPKGIDLLPAIGPGGLDGVGRSHSNKAEAIADALQNLKPHLGKAGLFVHIRGPDLPMEVSPYARLLASRRGQYLEDVGKINLSGVSLIEAFDKNSLAGHLEAAGIPVIELFVGRNLCDARELRCLSRGLCELAGFGALLKHKNRWPEAPELLSIEKGGILTIRAENHGLFSPSPVLGIDLYGKNHLGEVTDLITGEVQAGPEGPIGARVLALRHAGLVRVGDPLAQLAWPIDW